ncbi:hypothetical protein ACFWPA_19370 [Rhodococcus sp. NPDC058505]|uniref:hypothetical protein n=1 Tax=unclassified Rhodococcus (in: high G+C Gram-positive bacteria) TaxID=192944 RepID=UPI00365976C3
MGSAGAKVGTGRPTGDVDHLLGTPLAGTVIVVALIVGSAALIGVMTGSLLAVAVVAVGAVVAALILGGLDRVGPESGPGRDRPHHG